MVIRSENGNSSEHGACNWPSRHVCGEKPSEGAAEEEDGSLLLVDLELLYGFKDEQPLIIVHILFILNNGSFTVREAETSLVQSEDFVIMLGKAFGEHSILVCV